MLEHKNAGLDLRKENPQMQQMQQMSEGRIPQVLIQFLLSILSASSAD